MPGFGVGDYIAGGQCFIYQSALALQNTAQTTFFTRTPRFTAFGIVADDQRIAVEHGALKAGIRAHVFAYLFAQNTGIAPGGTILFIGEQQ